MWLDQNRCRDNNVTAGQSEFQIRIEEFGPKKGDKEDETEDWKIYKRECVMKHETFFIFCICFYLSLRIFSIERKSN